MTAIPKPAPPAAVEHADPHFFTTGAVKVCVCPCPACTKQTGTGPNDPVQCTCTDCPTKGCGLK